MQHYYAAAPKLAFALKPQRRVQLWHSFFGTQKSVDVKICQKPQKNKGSTELLILLCHVCLLRSLLLYPPIDLFICLFGQKLNHSLNSKARWVLIFIGTQRKLTSWFGGPSKGIAVPQMSIADGAQHSHNSSVLAQPSSANPLPQSQSDQGSLLNATVDGSQQIAQSGRTGSGLAPSTRPSSGSRAGQQLARAGQKSLKAFFQPPAAKAAAERPLQTTSPSPAAGSLADVASVQTSSCGDTDRQSHQAPPFKSQHPFLVTGDHVAGSSVIAPDQPASDAAHMQVAADTQSQDTTSLSQSQPSSAMSTSQSIPDTEKAAATEAWQRIHSKMKAPRCKGHSEDCVIREVKKNGPNKGKPRNF